MESKSFRFIYTWTCIINPNNDLSNLGLEYTLNIPNNAIKDSSGNYYAGLTNYKFKSKDNTTVVSVDPVMR